MACSAGSSEAIQLPYYGLGIIAGWPFVSEARMREVMHEIRQQFMHPVHGELVT